MTDDKINVPAKPCTAQDHYNRAAESITKIGEGLAEDDFSAEDLKMLLSVANTHALLGILKISIDKARWEGKMA